MERKPKNVNGMITNAAAAPAQSGAATVARQSVNAILNSMFDSECYKKRLNELLGERAPQFMSSVIALCNADANLAAAVRSAPQTVIQSALKAAENISAGMVDDDTLPDGVIDVTGTGSAHDAPETASETGVSSTDA